MLCILGCIRLASELLAYIGCSVTNCQFVPFKDHLGASIRMFWLAERSVTTEPIPAVEHIASDEERARLSLLAREMVYRFSGVRRQADQIVAENVSLPSTLFPG